jgi:hypothetical protein
MSRCVYLTGNSNVVAQYSKQKKKDHRRGTEPKNLGTEHFGRIFLTLDRRVRLPWSMPLATLW